MSDDERRMVRRRGTQWPQAHWKRQSAAVSCCLDGDAPFSPAFGTVEFTPVDRKGEHARLKHLCRTGYQAGCGADWLCRFQAFRRLFGLKVKPRKWPRRGPHPTASAPRSMCLPRQWTFRHCLRWRPSSGLRNAVWCGKTGPKGPIFPRPVRSVYLRQEKCKAHL